MTSNCLFSIIIVSWNTKILTLRAIQSILQQNMTNFEIIIVDNASTDGTVAAIKTQFPQVKLIPNSRNLGYPQANNQGIKAAKGRYIILLNSDAQILSKNALKIVRHSFNSIYSLGMLGGILFRPDGSIQAFGRSFLTLERLIKQQILFSSAHKIKIPANSQIKDADYIDGAFLAVDKKTIDDIGLMKEDFFMYGEDMEWCARAKSQGWQVKVHRDIHILHEHGASTQQNFARNLYQSALNICRFIYNYQDAKKAKLAFDVFICGMFLRTVTSILRRNNLAADYFFTAIKSINSRKSLKNLIAR